MSAPTTSQGCIVAIIGGAANYYEVGTGWTTTSANATLFATLAAAKDFVQAYGLELVGGCAVPALCLQDWTAR